MTPRRQYRVKPPLERFFRYVVQDGECWRWTGAADKWGYGQFRRPRAGSPAMAHRWLYEELVAEIPEGLQLDHLCRNPWCVNVLEHLDPVPGAVNLQRKAAAITHCPYGHEYGAPNERGHRRCIPCNRIKPRPIKSERCDGIRTTNYQYGCRCDLCRRADSVSQAGKRERRRQRADAEAAA